jgi:hypothetical protein
MLEARPVRAAPSLLKAAAAVGDGSFLPARRLAALDRLSTIAGAPSRPSRVEKL